MCGRFIVQSQPDELREVFPQLVLPLVLPPRYNVAPTQPVPAVRNDGRWTLEDLRWGLVPWWADDPKVGHRMINARCESAAEKRAFAEAFRRRRCLVLADGFYEWKKKSARHKAPMLIGLRSGRPFAFAGLWERWRAPDGTELLSCTVLTTEANELVAPIHDRMPVILPPEAIEAWLDPAEQDPAVFARWLRPYPAAELQVREVSTYVNDPQHEGPRCIEGPHADLGPLFGIAEGPADLSVNYKKYLAESLDRKHGRG